MASSEIGKTFSSNGGLMSYIPGTPPYTGITLDVLNPQLAHYFGLKNSTGLLVKSIDPNSPGLRAGVQAGDVICKADEVPMTSRSKWNHALRQNKKAAIKLQILRDRQPQTIDSHPGRQKILSKIARSASVADLHLTLSRAVADGVRSAQSIHQRRTERQRDRCGQQSGRKEMGAVHQPAHPERAKEAAETANGIDESDAGDAVLSKMFCGRNPEQRHGGADS